MSSEENIQKAADRLWQAWQAGETTAPIRDLLDEGDVAAAYAVQEINTRRWLGGEERQLSGRKIGLTSKAVQKQLGVGQPDYGMLFACTDEHRGHRNRNKESRKKSVLEPCA